MRREGYLVVGAFKLYIDMPVQLPDEADVLWNRGLTHWLRSHVEGLSRKVQLDAFGAARTNFDCLLGGPCGYAAFL